MGKQFHHQQKSQKKCETNIRKKVDHLSSCDWEALNTLTDDELSSALIPTEDYTEGLKALIIGNGNCLYNSASVVIQEDESANLILKLSVNNALHNK